MKAFQNLSPRNGPNWVLGAYSRYPLINELIGATRIDLNVRFTPGTGHSANIELKVR